MKNFSTVLFLVPFFSVLSGGLTIQDEEEEEGRLPTQPNSVDKLKIDTLKVSSPKTVLSTSSTTDSFSISAVFPRISALKSKEIKNEDENFKTSKEDVHHEEGQCFRPLGMEHGHISDKAITASSAFDYKSVGPQNARIRQDKYGGAWCPKSVISPKIREWIEIDLNGLYKIAGTGTQGRFDGGRGQEYAERFRLEYWRADGGGSSTPALKNRGNSSLDDGWIVYRNHTDHEILDGNTNTYVENVNELDPPVVASKVRFVPVADHPRMVCMRVELYGCALDALNSVVGYSTPPGDEFSPHLFVEDVFDGRLGVLTDGKVGKAVKYSHRGIEEAHGWVGWRKRDATKPVTINLEFQTTAELESVSLVFYQDKDFGIEPCSKIEVFQNEETADQNDKRPKFVRLETKNSRDLEQKVIGTNVAWNRNHGGAFVERKVEILREIVRKQKNFSNTGGKFVKLRIYFTDKWLFLSEISIKRRKAGDLLRGRGEDARGNGNEEERLEKIGKVGGERGKSNKKMDGNIGKTIVSSVGNQGSFEEADDDNNEEATTFNVGQANSTKRQILDTSPKKRIQKENENGRKSNEDQIERDEDESEAKMSSSSQPADPQQIYIGLVIGVLCVTVILLVATIVFMIRRNYSRSQKIYGKNPFKNPTAATMNSSLPASSIYGLQNFGENTLEANGGRGGGGGGLSTMSLYGMRDLTSLPPDAVLNDPTMGRRYPTMSTLKAHEGIYQEPYRLILAGGGGGHPHGQEQSVIPSHSCGRLCDYEEPLIYQMYGTHQDQNLYAALKQNNVGGGPPPPIPQTNSGLPDKNLRKFGSTPHFLTNSGRRTIGANNGGGGNLPPSMSYHNVLRGGGETLRDLEQQDLAFIGTPQRMINYNEGFYAATDILKEPEIDTMELQQQQQRLHHHLHPQQQQRLQAVSNVAISSSPSSNVGCSQWSHQQQEEEEDPVLRTGFESESISCTFQQQQQAKSKQQQKNQEAVVVVQIPRHRLKLIDKLGEGAFGMVHLCETEKCILKGGDQDAAFASPEELERSPGGAEGYPLLLQPPSTFGDKKANGGLKQSSSLDSLDNEKRNLKNFFQTLGDEKKVEETSSAEKDSKTATSTTQGTAVKAKVLVRSLWKGTSTKKRSEFIAEIQRLSGMSRHPNLARVLGQSTLDEPLCLVTEYGDMGSLRDFLRGKILLEINNANGNHSNKSTSSGSSMSQSSSVDTSLASHYSNLPFVKKAGKKSSTMAENQNYISVSELLDISKQIASGMKYLESHGCVHRDLSTRNCLLQSGGRGSETSNYKVLISDWSHLAEAGQREGDYLTISSPDSEAEANPSLQDEEDKEANNVKARILPLRWIPWEVFFKNEWSTKSDVWSFGVTLWEIFGLCGQRPYPHLTDEQVRDNLGRMIADEGQGLSSFYQLPQKHFHTPLDVQSLMTECWKIDPQERPGFNEILTVLQTL